MLKRISNEMQCSENNTSVWTNLHTPNGKHVTIVQLYIFKKIQNKVWKWKPYGNSIYQRISGVALLNLNVFFSHYLFLLGDNKVDWLSGVWVNRKTIFSEKVTVSSFELANDMLKCSKKRVDNEYLQ